MAPVRVLPTFQPGEDRHARLGPTQRNFGQQWCWKRKIEDMAFHAVNSSN